MNKVLKVGHTPDDKTEGGMAYIMSSKKEKQIDLNNLTPEEELKYEIAEELGLLDKVMECGWKTLSAKETGRIGGLMTKRKKEMKKEALSSEIL